MIVDSIMSFWRSMTERLTKPFFGAFSISWIIWNWKFLYLLLFGDEPKRQLIEQAELQLSIFCSLVYPCISALAYLLGVPWIDMIISRFQRIPNDKRIREEYASQHAVLTAKKNLVELQADLALSPEKKRLKFETEKLDAELKRTEKIEEMKLKHEKQRLDAEEQRNIKQEERQRRKMNDISERDKETHEKKMRDLELEIKRAELDNLKKNGTKTTPKP